jgi:hypothetical protein
MVRARPAYLCEITESERASDYTTRHNPDVNTRACVISLFVTASFPPHLTQAFSEA